MVTPHRKKRERYRLQRHKNYASCEDEQQIYVKDIKKKGRSWNKYHSVYQYYYFRKNYTILSIVKIHTTIGLLNVNKHF